MKSSSQKWTFAATVLLLTSGIAIAIATEQSGDVPRMFGGKDAVQVVKQAKTVRAYRVVGTNESYKSLDEYKMRGDPVEISPSQAKALADLLTGRGSYLWDVAKGCQPIYGVRVEFVAGKQSVDVMFCFDCDILTVFFNDKRVGGEDFDKIRTKLLKIIKPLFPDDKVIGALED